MPSCHSSAGPPPPPAHPPPPRLAHPPPAVAGWDAEQVTYAQVIIAVGVRKAVPPRGWIIAVAYAKWDDDATTLLARRVNVFDAPSLRRVSRRGAKNAETVSDLIDSLRSLRLCAR